MNIGENVPIVFNTSNKHAPIISVCTVDVETPGLEEDGGGGAAGGSRRKLSGARIIISIITSAIVLPSS